MKSSIPIKIINSLPYLESFLFVDDLTEVNNSTICGHYTFKKNEFFVDAHFKHIQVTPGVILVEMMGQIGLVCHLVYLEKLYEKETIYHPLLTYVEANFFQEVKIEDKLTVKGEKIYLRKGILKSKVELYNSKKELCSTLTAQLLLKKDSING
ncbi:MAG TPA: hypothetical protein PKN32_04660 [Bacteroidales bacterium]|nr:hypothetical protein [Bacteroidales bacterium]